MQVRQLTAHAKQQAAAAALLNAARAAAEAAAAEAARLLERSKADALAEAICLELVTQVALAETTAALADAERRSNAGCALVSHKASQSLAHGQHS